ncbi:MAG: tyrosine-type recombinase/integrase [Bacteroidota bacterium]|nr:tyrosine-type recombinase/integrase [Bacteroidota bacterium]
MKNKFYNYIQFQKRLSPHSVIAYQNDVNQFQQYIHYQYGLTNFNEVKYTFVRSWIVSLMEKGLSAKSIHRKISSIKALYKFLRKEGLIDVNPVEKVNLPKVSHDLPVFLTENQTNDLFDRVEFFDDYYGKRDKTILLLFYSTGIRLSELISLNESDVDICGQAIKVLGKRKKQRIIPITKELEIILEEFIALKKLRFLNVEKDESYLFLTDKGKKLYPNYVYRIVKKYLGVVSTNKKKSPHVLRHTFATHMLDNGAELNAVKELLGHANLSATQVYTHNTVEKLKSIYKQAHPKA